MTKVPTGRDGILLTSGWSQKSLPSITWNVPQELHSPGALVKAGSFASITIHGRPILIAALADPSTTVKVDGINYFFDTMLFAGAILTLASATPRTD